MKRFPIIHSLFLLCLLALPFSNAYSQRLRGVNAPTSIDTEGINTLGDWNANVVRYQLSMGEAVQTATPAEYLSWLSGELDKLDTFLPTFDANGIVVIIDLHSPPGGFASTNGFPLLKIFTDSEARQTLFDAWDAIASRYSGNSSIFAYELVSEPGTGGKGANPAWPQLASELITQILAVDANCMFVVAPDYAHFNKLKKLSKSLKSLLGQDVYEQHVIHSVHLFFPNKYVKQGLEGNKLGVKYPSKRATKKVLRDKLKQIKKIQKKAKLNRLLIGEFAVVRWAPGASNYLNNLLRFFEKFGWDYTYHIFREHHSWDLERTDDPDSLEKSPSDSDRLTVMKGYFVRNQ